MTAWLQRFADHMENGGVGSQQWYESAPLSHRVAIWAVALTFIAIITVALWAIVLW